MVLTTLSPAKLVEGYQLIRSYLTCMLILYKLMAENLNSQHLSGEIFCITALSSPN